MMYRFKFLLFLLFLFSFFCVGYVIAADYDLSTRENLYRNLSSDEVYVSLKTTSTALTNSNLTEMSEVSSTDGFFSNLAGTLTNLDGSERSWLVVYNTRTKTFLVGTSQQFDGFRQLFATNPAVVLGFISSYPEPPPPVGVEKIVDLSSLSYQIFNVLKSFWKIGLEIALSIIVLNVAAVFYPPLQKFIAPVYAPRYFVLKGNMSAWDSTSGRLIKAGRYDTARTFSDRIESKNKSNYERSVKSARRDWQEAKRRRDEFWGKSSRRRGGW